MSGYNSQKMKQVYREYRNANPKKTIIGIANEIGINKNSFMNYIEGAQIPGAEILYKIAIFFGKTPDSFFDFPKDKKLSYEQINTTHTVNEPEAVYESEAKAWRVAYETQQRLTEALMEIERLKKHDAHVSAAKAG